MFQFQPSPSISRKSDAQRGQRTQGLIISYFFATQHEFFFNVPHSHGTLKKSGIHLNLKQMTTFYKNEMTVSALVFTCELSSPTI